MIRTGLPLIRVTRAVEERFQAPGGSSKKTLPPRTREQHAARLLRELDAVQQARRPQEDRAPHSEGQLIAATGTTGFADQAHSLGDKNSDAIVVAVDQGQALLHVHTDARALRKKVERYRDEDTKSGAPKHAALVARIEDLRVPTLADLSLREFSEDDIDPGQSYWVELWTRGGRLDDGEDRARVREDIHWLADLGGFRGMPRQYEGVERDIFLARLTGDVLAELPGLMPEVYEVHFAPRVRLVETLLQGEAKAAPPVGVEPPPEDAAVVAVYDTGTSAHHPYLRPALLGTGSVVPGEPDAADRHGHGTEMAGIAVYPDYLQGVAQGVLRPQNRLVGMRLIPTPGGGPADDEPEFWAERTEAAVTEAEDLADEARVVHSLSVGADNDSGLRTAWSIGVDQLAWNSGRGRLMVVAAGNLPDNMLATEREDDPVANLGQPICQPAQAWNALTVGGFTALGGAAANGKGPYPEALAPVGGLSPYASTDVGVAGRPIKPDIVKEAGNTAPGGGLPNAGGEHLSLWTTSHRHTRGELSTQTWATSPAAASAAADLAVLARKHPDLGPAALRALYVHSAQWTPVMWKQFTDRKDRLRAVGYSVPDLRAASGADSNRPVFVYEGHLAPGGRQAQMLRIPLPDHIISDHADSPVRLAITLAYFIEPTEAMAGRQYAGGRLRWEMQGPTENELQLRRRINKLARSGTSEAGPSSGYTWTIGSQARGRGTLQHDYVELNASELAGDRLLAVFPILGWWEQRESTKNLEIPYAIVVSVDSYSEDIDLYAAIQASIATNIET
ncbi:S8 family peptidase [Amycolatopsis alkalitolerans]|uniref:S8 family peptidase n=1 Tax=Amycolatopsis alkalitolerans TaxID=2547244 RepID=A0A5C4M9H3_9PSEU|nr:S8 family peptidase [Amycolatopsis alkalitolerans]TNC28024.1 S8 family peptidase [Amycolatopsis alkalitolerans]